MASEVVGNDDITSRQGGLKELLDICEEGVTVDGASISGATMQLCRGPALTFL